MVKDDEEMFEELVRALGNNVPEKGMRKLIEYIIDTNWKVNKLYNFMMPRGSTSLDTNGYWPELETTLVKTMINIEDLTWKAAFIWAHDKPPHDISTLVNAYGIAKQLGYEVGIWCNVNEKDKHGIEFQNDWRGEPTQANIINDCFGNFLQGNADGIRVFIDDHSHWVNGATGFEFYDGVPPGNSNYIVDYAAMNAEMKTISNGDKCLVVRGRNSGRAIPPLCTSDWAVITTQSENESVDPDQYNIACHLTNPPLDCYNMEKERLAGENPPQNPKICM